MQTDDITPIPPCPHGIPQTLWEAEWEREKQALEDGITRFEKRVQSAKELGVGSSLAPQASLLARMVVPVSEALTSWVENARSGKPGPRHEVLPLLLMLPDLKVAAYLACKAVVDELLSDTRTYNRLAFHIAERLETEVRIKFFQDQNAKKARKAIVQSQRYSMSYMEARLYILRAANKGLTQKLPKFLPRQKALLGAVCIDLIQQTTGIITTREEFSGPKQSTKFVVPTPEITKAIQGKLDVLKDQQPVFAPLLCPPRPWENPYDGGYWHIPTTLVRKGKPAYLEELANSPGIQRVYTAVNALQDTAWEINPVVFNTMQELWDRQDYPHTFMVPAQDPPAPSIDETLTGIALEKAKRDYGLYKRTVKTNASKRKALLLSMSVAREYVGSTFWFSYNLDFRGRVYPLAYHLTPQGDDAQKGMLCFAKSKLVETQEQVDCLAIHGANCFGNRIDKLPFAGRLEWVKQHEDSIIMCASDPLANRWWTLADEPFQFLAFCLEWTTFLGEGLGVFQTKLPVAVDGTCSGLQHFSAMLRDPIGAAATNLIPAERPQDIYGIVAGKTMEKVRGRMLSDKLAQQWGDFGLDRSGAKRPVMTLPYGATRYSAREYIQEWLEEKMAAGRKSTFDVGTFQASMYMVDFLWESIGETVVAARAAMDWLQAVARIVAKSGNPVWWTTPTGFQVFQGYPNTKQRTVKTSLQGKQVFVSYREDARGYDPSKAASGLAPNFVHSMDASALILTVLGCLEHGMDSFGMVHDSFACHCTDMPTLNKVLRDAFVTMYTDHDVLAEFEAQVREVLPADTKLPPRPSMGTLDLQCVKESPYFFS
jgi:DNA-directed RNA polymerase